MTREPRGRPTPCARASRSKLLMRLNSLADDARLRIMELVAQKVEMSTPDIIVRPQLSQSAASRHLEHLAATGCFVSRRAQGPNLYQLNPNGIDETFEGLMAFLKRWP